MVFVFGQEEYLVNFKVKQILKNQHPKANFYDQTATIEDLLLDISTVAMFFNQKVIVIRDHPIFTDLDLSKQFLKELQNITLKHVNLIFVLTTEFNNTNPFIKYLMQNANCHKIDKVAPQNLGAIVRKIVEENGATISSGAIINLIHKMPHNLRLIVNEVKKLLLDSSDITEQKVDQLVDNYYSEDYFALSNAIIDDNKHAIIKYYNEKLHYGEEPVAIISQIAQTLNLSMLVGHYKKQGFSLQQISKQTQIHIFRVKKAHGLLQKQSLNKISDLIIKLADLETDIKTTVFNHSRGVDWFMLELIK